jgi:hypothetical protein
MATIQSARRTLSAWSQTQRRALSMSANATPSERARSDVDHVEVLLLAVLAALGVGGYGLALEDVRADVRPAGYAVELSDDDLTAAFA